MRDDTEGRAALAAIEIVIWQLVVSGTIPAMPLADELERYVLYMAISLPFEPSPKWLAQQRNEAAEKTPDSKTADSQAGSACSIRSDRSGVSARKRPYRGRPCELRAIDQALGGKTDSVSAPPVLNFGVAYVLWIAERRSATWPAICAPLAALLPFRMRSNRHAQGCPVDL